MSDQILTQEEIDALLSAMDRGDVNLKEEEKEAELAEAVPYNLTSQNIMLRDQFYALEEVYDKFATLLNHSLSTTLQRSMDVAFISTEMVKYGQFIGAFSNPSSFHIFNMEPLIGSALLAIDASLVFSLIDCMFGGSGKPTSQIRDFTLIEQRMIKKFASELLSRLEEAWAVVHPIKTVVRKTETKPEFVHLLPPNDLVVSIVFELKGEEFSGNLNLCISYLTLEPIKDKLSSKYLRENDSEHAWSDQLQQLLQDTPVTLIAELGKTTRTIKDLLKLQVDDVLKLDKGPEDLITLSVDHIPKYAVFPGIIKGNRAVEIAHLLRPNGGQK
ncbi:MAG: flagellar motor switch protein FliM [Desulfobacterales bacterium]|nr:MAG: flagellar motor switch protein FliM [Desulfobacterales bacterium]